MSRLGDTNRTYKSALADVEMAISDLEAALDELEAFDPPMPVDLRYLGTRPEIKTRVPADAVAPTVEDATDLVLRFYNRARDHGWTTPEMDDARQYLRRVAPQEVW